MTHDARRNVQAHPGSTGVGAGTESPGKRTLTEGLAAAPPVQRKAAEPAADGAVHEAAERGVTGGGGPLPHLDQIQRSFGGHDVSHVKAHTGGEARSASHEIGAQAYAMGDHVAFAETPDLHTAAHEAAHVVQQRGGVQLKGGVGEAGDQYERHADAVADLVVQGQSAEGLLDQHAGGGGAATGGGAPATQQRAVQRMVRIMPAQFLNGLGVTSETATATQVDEYIKIAIKDEMNSAINIADALEDEKESKKWKKSFGDALKVFLGADKTPAQKVAGLNKLVPILNKFLTDNAAKANSETRYHTKPTQDWIYSHSALSEENPTWGDDDGMRSKIAKGMGPKVSADAYDEAAPAKAQNKDKEQINLPLKQLPWEEAKRLLPRPLINLIFDVRYQLENGGQGDGVIDERTQDERNRKEKSPSAGGTLRSWHQDSKGVLPRNGFDGDVPAGSQALHDHYAENSTTGAGSSIGDGVAGPQGLAEYTGTGSNWEHNTKVVLDYVGKRVYLTLSHYQYWALIKNNGNYEFFDSSTQELSQAEGRLEKWKKEHPQAEEVIMMSPWMEIVMPTRATL